MGVSYFVFLLGASAVFFSHVEAKVNCIDPPPHQPKMCCRASTTAAGHMEVVKEHHGECACNSDWSHAECTCRGIVFKTFCHHCMVNLPASNQMVNAYSSKELYERCEDCVEQCKSEVPPMCTEFFDAWQEETFSAAPMEDIICSRNTLRDKLHQDSYPDTMKKALYRTYAEQEKTDYWMDSQWSVPVAPSHAALRAGKKKAALKKAMQAAREQKKAMTGA